MIFHTKIPQYSFIQASKIQNKLIFQFEIKMFKLILVLFGIIAQNIEKIIDLKPFQYYNNFIIKYLMGKEQKQMKQMTIKKTKNKKIPLSKLLRQSTNNLPQQIKEKVKLLQTATLTNIMNLISQAPTDPQIGLNQMKRAITLQQTKMNSIKGQEEILTTEQLNGENQQYHLQQLKWYFQEDVDYDNLNKPVADSVDWMLQKEPQIDFFL